MSDVVVSPDERSVDTLFAGQLVLRQLRQGHRAGTDAVLLAVTASAMPVTRFIDVGAGSGAVGLWLGLQNPQAHGVLLERDASQAALARDNAERNGVADRVRTVSLDLLDVKACREATLPGSADLVVSNPPFYSSSAVRPSPDRAKAAAHVLPSSPDADRDPGAAWASRLCDFLQAKGRLLIIHRPAAVPMLLQAVGRRCGSFVLRPIHAKANEPAIRILLAATLGGRAPLNLLPPIILHGDDGSFTDTALMINAGVAPWSGQQKTGPEGPVHVHRRSVS